MDVDADVVRHSRVSSPELGTSHPSVLLPGEGAKQDSLGGASCWAVAHTDSGMVGLRSGSGRGRAGERAGSDFSAFCLIFPLRPQ